MNRPLPNGWRRVRLGEFVQERPEFIGVRDGHSYKRITLQLRNQGIKLRDEVRGQELRTKKQRVVRPGDLVVAEIDAKVGGFGIAPPEADGAIVSSHYYLFSVDQTICDIGYLGACIRKGLLSRQVFAVGSTNYAAIRSRDVLDYRVPLPPMPEQKRITDALRVMDDAIRANEEVLERTRDFKKALAHELLTRGLPGHHTRFKDSPLGQIPAEWEVKRLGEVLDRIETGISPRCEDRPAAPEEWGVVKVSAVSWGRFLPDENKALPINHDVDTSLEIKTGDLLTSRGNTPDLVGRTVHVKEVRPRLILSDLTRRLIVNKGIVSSGYLNVVMNSSLMRLQVERVATGSARSMKKVSQSALNGLLVPVPGAYEQAAIVQLFEGLADADNTDTDNLGHLRNVLRSSRDALLAGAQEA